MIVEWCAFIQLIVILTLNYIRTKEIITLFNIFLVFSYLFHFGQSTIQNLIL